MIKEFEILLQELDHVNPDLTPEDVVDWISHPVTQQLFRDAKINLIKSLDGLDDVPLDTLAIAQASESKGERNTYKWLLEWGLPDESDKD